MFAADSVVVRCTYSPRRDHAEVEANGLQVEYMH